MQRRHSLTLTTAATAVAQVATYSSNNCALSVNVPSDSASSGSGPIFFQISAPSGIQWVAFGQGSRMSGSNMFVVYAQDSNNVTLSGRAGTGYSMPQHDSSIQLTLLEGSGIASDGSMVANVRCDNCNNWSGGSMSYTDSSSSWIFASLSGSALNTDDVSARISQHNLNNGFTLDLTQGTGGSSSNPFYSAQTPSDTSSSASATGSAGSSASQTAAATGTQSVSTPAGTNAVSNPLASTGATSGSASQTKADPNGSLSSAHGIIMSVLFLGCFPFFALTVYLPTTKKVRFIHAPLQVLSVILLIVGLALGILLGQRIGQLDAAHQIIGFIVSFSLILFQPAMGLYQHLYYHRTGGSSSFGAAHRWLGRTMIILGIINGGLGWQLTSNTPAYVPYGIVAGIVFLIYVSVVVFAWYRSGSSKDVENEKAQQRGGYEMQSPRSQKHTRLGSDMIGNNAYAEQQTRKQPGATASYR